MSSLFDQYRNIFNNAIDNATTYAGTTYNKVSTDFGEAASQIIPAVTGGMVNPQPVQSTQPTQPNKPAQPIQPTQPIQPAQPTQPFYK